MLPQGEIDETAEVIAKALIRNYPDFEFKVYYPAVKEQRKLKNGSISVKLKPLFPGYVFRNCVMNKEIHDFIREVDRVGGFVGSKVGNTRGTGGATCSPYHSSRSQT
ncbi:uncharacterized protein A4U43_C04F16010 [Asparagus officinalis]|uniref:NusG-like N-terminal domain-containing protein n=1 Tax=Asparagus officinalis TaxID=4686 RepID=A0A5P1F195_ASPOF|nr:uncharacterized protein LOC109835937 [Asparagus officinalis]ONK72125.1 uncharacterized protein A4U43_C04F16010 [Asparagus officinalis]